MCRTGTSAGAEAATILLTFPHPKVGCSAKGTGSLDEKWLGTLLLQATWVFLRYEERVFDFDIDDPVPDSDHKYGVANESLHTIFVASRDDPVFDNSRTLFDVVTDGNTQCSRELSPDENKIAKQGLPGRPKKMKNKKSTQQSSSRCKAVTTVEHIKLARTQTGGLFVTMNMKNRQGGKNEVLHLAEMLNGECTDYERKCLVSMNGQR